MIRQFMNASAILAAVLVSLAGAPEVPAQTAPASAPLPSFEVVSIKPNHSGGYFAMHRVTASGFRMVNLNTRFLIEYAYGQHSVPPYDALRPSQLEGGPGWIRTEQYDVDARVDDALVEKFKKMPHDRPYLDAPGAEAQDQIRLMMQSMLVERFHLTVHREMRQVSVFALKVAQAGPRVQPSADPLPSAGFLAEATGSLPAQTAPLPKPQPCPQGMRCITQARISMDELAYFLWDMGDHHVVPEIGRPVINRTGLQGEYAFTIQWAPSQTQPGMGAPGEAPPTAPTENAGPSFFTALQEQLGLKLVPAKGPVEYVVVDHIEKPTEN